MAGKLNLPDAGKPFGEAVVKLPDGKEMRVQVFVNKEWLQKFEELVRIVNGLS